MHAPSLIGKQGNIFQNGGEFILGPGTIQLCLAHILTYNLNRDYLQFCAPHATYGGPCVHMLSFFVKTGYLSLNSTSSLPSIDTEIPDLLSAAGVAPWTGKEVIWTVFSQKCLQSLWYWYAIQWVSDTLQCVQFPWAWIISLSVPKKTLRQRYTTSKVGKSDVVRPLPNVDISSDFDVETSL